MQPPLRMPSAPTVPCRSWKRRRWRPCTCYDRTTPLPLMPHPVHVPCCHHPPTILHAAHKCTEHLIAVPVIAVPVIAVPVIALPVIAVPVAGRLLHQA